MFLLERPPDAGGVAGGVAEGVAEGVPAAAPAAPPADAPAADAAADADHARLLGRRRRRRARRRAVCIDFCGSKLLLFFMAWSVNDFLESLQSHSPRAAARRGTSAISVTWEPFGATFKQPADKTR